MSAFFCKKLIAALLLPLPISLLLGILGLFLLLIHRLRKTAYILISLGVIILLTFSISFLPNLMLRNLESRYPPLVQAPTKVKAIVVLGGGVGGNSNFPANTRLNSASLSRLVVAVRLYRQLMNKNIKVKLILSGGRVFRNRNTDAGRMKNIALVLGVNKKQILLENGSVDTYHEAIYLKSFIHHQPFILITSAFHMQRAVALFEKQGMHPIPAPTQFLANRWRNNPVKRYVPSAISLVYTDIALHEYFGMVWAKIKGHV